METIVMEQVENRQSDQDELKEKFGLEEKELEVVTSKYPVRISKYYLGLICEKHDPIWKQSVPDVKELESIGINDPLCEEHDSPVKCIVHRYPDRVLFYSTSECAMFCRFCTRKRKVGKTCSVSKEDWDAGFDYIKQHPEIRDVLVSGGDPLMLPNFKLDYILSKLRAIQHVQIIRIGSRMPVVNPHRITDHLCDMLKQHHPLYLNTHFNHPREITDESAKACNRLANAGIPLGNQSVLLKGVNDNIDTMKLLVQKLLSIRVKPYYIFMMDLVKGADHFRTSVQTGLEIIRGLRGHTSGMAVPQLVVDAPGGGGKIPIMPDSVVSAEQGVLKLKNFEGKCFEYPLE